AQRLQQPRRQHRGRRNVDRHVQRDASPARTQRWIRARPLCRSPRHALARRRLQARLGERAAPDQERFLLGRRQDCRRGLNRSTSMADDQSEWTPEQLGAELRARERSGAGAQTHAARSFTRFRKLSEIPSSELAKRAADLQRSIYGVDDRKDTYEVKDANTRQLIEASL